MSESGASSDSDGGSSVSLPAAPPLAQRRGAAKKKPAGTAIPAAAGAAAAKKGKLTPSEKELEGRQQAPKRASNLTMEKLRKDPKAIFILVLACESPVSLSLYSFAR